MDRLNMKPNINKVNSVIARQSLKNADEDRQKAYSQYILLMYRSTGRLAPGCDAKDLQAFYDQEDEDGQEGQHGAF